MCKALCAILIDWILVYVRTYLLQPKIGDLSWWYRMNPKGQGIIRRVRVSSSGVGVISQ